MDADRFDGLLRALAASPSRRGVGRILAGLVVGASLDARFDLVGIGAKKGKGRGKKKKKKKPCGPGNCTECCVGCCGGCCNDAGQCVPGTSDDACESGGFPCDNCAAQGLVCREQSCGCSVDCAGCCLDSLSCEPGNSIDACGSDGEACKTCANDQVCIRNQANNNAYACCGNKGAFCGEERVIIGGQIVSVIQHDCCFNHRCNDDTKTCEPRCKANEIECKNDAGFTFSCCTPPDRCDDGQCVGPCGPNGIVCGTPGPDGTAGTRRCCIGGEICCQSAGVCYTPGKLNCSHTPGHHIKNVCPDDTGKCCYPPHPNNIGLLVCQYGPNCIDGYASEPFFVCPDG